MSIESLTPLILEYRYWILIPLSFIEGPIVAFITGTLSWLGYFNPYLALAIFFARDVMVDGFMYALGRFGRNTTLAKRILKKFSVTSEHLDDVRLLWERHGFRTMFLSKLSYGVSAAFLIVAGMVRVNYRTFFAYASAVALLQYGLLFLLGYFFGNSVGGISGVLEKIQYAVAIGALFIAVYYIFTRFMRRRLIEEEQKASKDS